MSTFSDLYIPSKSHKVNISMMLNVPIDLEIEVFMLPPTNPQIDEDKTITSQTVDSGSEVSISGVNLAMFNQIVDQLKLDDQFVSTFPQTQHQQNNPEQHAPQDTLPSSENFAPIQPLEKKPSVRVFDKLNDSLTLVVNTMGRILFLGKLANYSWE